MVAVVNLTAVARVRCILGRIGPVLTVRRGRWSNETVGWPRCRKPSSRAKWPRRLAKFSARSTRGPGIGLLPAIASLRACIGANTTAASARGNTCEFSLACGFRPRDGSHIRLIDTGAQVLGLLARAFWISRSSAGHRSCVLVSLLSGPICPNPPRTASPCGSVTPARRAPPSPAPKPPRAARMRRRARRSARASCPFCSRHRLGVRARRGSPSRGCS